MDKTNEASVSSNNKQFFIYKMEKDNQTNTLPNPLLNSLDNILYFIFSGLYHVKYEQTTYSILTLRLKLIKIFQGSVAFYGR